MAKSRVSKAPKTSPFGAIGSSGLKRTGNRGQVYEEFLPELRGTQARKMYRQMRDNDDVVGAVLFVTENILRAAAWDVQGTDEEANEFVEQCRSDITPSWNMFVAEALSMLTYGFAPFEIVYKRRRGKQAKPSLSSKFEDGKIGWRGWELRSQDSLTDWVWDENGDVTAMVQQVMFPVSGAATIPMEKLLLFRTTAHKNNPEGRSLLRNAFRSFYMRHKLENLEAVGAERDLAGLPVIYCDAANMDSTLPNGRTMGEVLKEIVRNIRRDEQEGVLMPLSFDDKGNQLIKLELLSSGGSRQFNCGEIIQRYRAAIAQTMVADFVLLGHEKVGSLALASSKTSMFGWAVRCYLDLIAEPLNEKAIPDLFAMNG